MARPAALRALIPSVVAASVLLGLAAPASAAIVRHPKCGIKAADIVGTEEGELIEGTKGDDVIVALGGDDQVVGRGGDDVICGGDGFDNALDGGPGDDRISGGPGEDVLLGEAGRDWSFGDEDDDVLVEPSNDREINLLEGGPGNDDLEGGKGGDIIAGQGDNDKLDGAGGNDELEGGDGEDNLLGGPGADIVDGGGETDVVAGEGGADERIDGGKGDDRVNAGPGADENVTGLSGNDLVVGAGGDDFLQGGSDNDQIDGGPGDDKLYGEAGDDKCSGGTGSDLCNGGPPTPSNPENDPDICTKDVEKKRSCREEGKFPLRWTGTLTGTGTGEDGPAASGPGSWSYEIHFTVKRSVQDSESARYEELEAGTIQYTASGTDLDCTYSESGSMDIGSAQEGEFMNVSMGLDQSGGQDRYDLELDGNFSVSGTASCPYGTFDYQREDGVAVSFAGPWNSDSKTITDSMNDGSTNWDLSMSGS